MPSMQMKNTVAIGLWMVSKYPDEIMHKVVDGRHNKL